MEQPSVLTDSPAECGETSAFTLFFEKNPVPMWIHDEENGQLLAANEAAVDFYGCSRAGLLRKTVRDLIEPDRAGTHCLTGVLRILRADGQTQLVEVASRPCIFRGRPALFVCLHRAFGRVGWVASIEQRARELQAAVTKLEEIIVDGSMRLARACERWDPTTGAHLQRVRVVSEALAREFGFDGVVARRVGLASIVHDVGKIVIPTEILTKPGPLTEQEWEIVKRHPLTGLEIVADAPEVPMTREVVRHHHENFDGSGYPDGLAGERIPVAARIVRVADAFDAMVSIRPYKQARSVESAVAEIEACRGKQFCPEVEAALRRLYESGLLHSVYGCTSSVTHQLPAEASGHHGDVRREKA